MAVLLEGCGGVGGDDALTKENWLKKKSRRLLSEFRSLVRGEGEGRGYTGITFRAEKGEVAADGGRVGGRLFLPADVLGEKIGKNVEAKFVYIIRNKFRFICLTEIV